MDALQQVKPIFDIDNIFFLKKREVLQQYLVKLCHLSSYHIRSEKW